jgi:hypothetical protein
VQHPVDDGHFEARDESRGIDPAWLQRPADCPPSKTALLLALVWCLDRIVVIAFVAALACLLVLRRRLSHA